MGRERAILGSLVALLFVLSAGFFVHRAPRFPGSLTGGVLATAGATLMIVFSLAYTAIKRIAPLKRRIGDRISSGRLLTWHVHTGAIGAILALLHTGHRFESDLGIALTTMMLISVLSGYAGRHLLGRVALELHEKQRQLGNLENAYNETVGALARNPDPLMVSAASSGAFSALRLRAAFALSSGRRDESPAYRAVQMAESIAELHHSISAHGRYKKLLALWLKVHIGSSVAFYILLAVHVWAGIHFGLRWFS